MEKIYHKLFYSIGLLCTMNTLSIASIGVYNYLIVILLSIRLIQILLSKKKNVYLSSKNILWYMFFLIMFISLIHSSLFMPNIWFKESFSLTLKFAIYILGLMFLFGNNNLLNYKKDFILGLYFSTIIQLLWGILQAALWYIIGLNLNEIVFGNILNIGGGNINWQSSIIDSAIRLTGFSWEAANFALVMLIGWSLAKSNILKSLFILALVFSYSKTGFLCMFILGIIRFFIVLKNIKYNKILVFKFNIIIKCMMGIVLCIIIFIIFEDIIMEMINTATTLYEIVKISIFTDEDYSGNIHKSYYLMLGNVVNNMSLWQCFFGYGTFSAGYPYGLYNIVPYGTEQVWNPESDFITIIVGNGFLGIIIYYLIMIKAYFSTLEMKERYIILSIFICGITYLFIRGTWSCLLLLFISLQTRGIKNEKEEKNDVFI